MAYHKFLTESADGQRIALWAMEKIILVSWRVGKQPFLASAELPTCADFLHVYAMETHAAAATSAFELLPFIK